MFAVLAITVFSLSSFDITRDSAGTWKFIGDKKVSFGVDHDVINVGEIGDKFRALRLKVTDGPIRIYDMKVHFDNGTVQDVSLRMTIPENGESRIINLHGGLRQLKKIEFWYETAGFQDGKSRVAVWGRR
jgi:hypothetical protein